MGHFRAKERHRNQGVSMLQTVYQMYLIILTMESFFSSSMGLCYKHRSKSYKPNSNSTSSKKPTQTTLGSKA